MTIIFYEIRANFSAVVKENFIKKKKKKEGDKERRWEKERDRTENVYVSIRFHYFLINFVFYYLSLTNAI